MSTTKAKLLIILKADETIVAEVDNPLLWQRVLASIHSSEDGGKSFQEIPPPLKETSEGIRHEDNDAVTRLARHIEVSKNDLVGAIDPSADSPYLRLDVHCWEAMKKQVPAKGRGAINPTAVVSTLLCLWFKEAGLGNPTQAQALGVLDGINLKDTNASRNIKNTPWLQGRSGGSIVINPAQVSKAYSVAKSFCTKKWNKDDTE